jgi:hypothetical protein
VCTETERERERERHTHREKERKRKTDIECIISGMRSNDCGMRSNVTEYDLHFSACCALGTAAIISEEKVRIGEGYCAFFVFDWKERRSNA